VFPAAQTQAAQFFPNHPYDPADLVVLSVSIICTRLPPNTGIPKISAHY
jgi:hypothetical protein